MDCIRCKEQFDSRSGTCPRCAWNPDETLDHLAGYRLGDRVSGRYELRESLGIGRLGTVLRALDRDTGMEVALKIIHPALLPDRRMQERFLKGIGTLTGITHTGMARFLGAGIDDFGHCFFARQLVDGLPLVRLMENRGVRGRLFSVDEVLPVVDQICELLNLGGGFVHGALSPDKIWILPNHLKMTDAGIARYLPPAAVWHRMRRSSISRSYAAPEMGEGREPDSRADLFALGVLVGEMLTQAVFNGDQAEYGDRLDALSPGLRAVLRGALERSPERRYRRAVQLASALASFSSPKHRDEIPGEIDTDLGQPQSAKLPKEATPEDTLQIALPPDGEEQTEKTAQVSMAEVMKGHEQAVEPPREDWREAKLRDIAALPKGPSPAEKKRSLIEPRRPDAAARPSRPPGFVAPPPSRQAPAPVRRTADGIGPYAPPGPSAPSGGRPAPDTERREVTQEIAIEEIQEVDARNVEVIVDSLEKQAYRAQRDSTQELIRRADKLDGVDPRFVRAAHALESDRRSSSSKLAADILRQRTENLDGIDPRLLRAAARLEEAKIRSIEERKAVKPESGPGGGDPGEGEDEES